MLRSVATARNTYPRANKIALTQPNITIGRDEDNVDIVLDSTVFPRMISRVHAHIVRRDDGGYRLEDNNSVNGVYVNEVQVNGKIDLNNGDIVVFGRNLPTSEFIFEYTAPEPLEEPDEPPKKKRAIESETETTIPSSTVAGSEITGDLREEFVCIICQEWMFKAVTLECSHSFCGTCIKEWMSAKTAKQCPTCREPVARSPVPARTIDLAIEKVVATLPDDDTEKIEYMNRKKEREEELKQVETFSRLMEVARQRNYKVLNIKNTWSTSERAAFCQNIKSHSGLVRTKYCEEAGLTLAFIRGAPVQQLRTALNNIGQNPSNNMERCRENLKKFVAGV